MKIKQVEEFDSLIVFAILIKHKLLIIGTSLLAGVISAILAFVYLPNEYKSTVNVVPPQTSMSGMESALGSISGALKDIGLTKLGGSGGETYNFIVILSSRSIMDSLIEEFDLSKVYDIPKNEMSLVRMKLEENLDINYERDGNYYISVWDTDKKRAADMANKIVELANNLAMKIYREEASLNKKNMEERLHGTDSTMRAVADTLQKFSKRTGMYYPTEQASALSKSIADLKSEEIKYDIFYDYYSKIYGQDDFTTQSILGMKQKMTEKIEEVKNQPGFAGNFALDDAAREGIEFLRLYAELETYTKLKSFLLPMIEKNKLDETKNLKNLIVLDKAIPADKKDRPRRSLIVAGSVVGVFSLTIFIILLVNSIRTASRKIKQINSQGNES